MINVSDDFKAVMAERTDYRERGEVTLLDGTELVFTEDDFTIDNNSFADAARSKGLPLGTVVCRTAQIELWNGDGHLSVYDFYGATIKLKLTLALDNGTTEPINVGTFTVAENPVTTGDTLIIQLVDDMYKLDKPYKTGLTYPLTAGRIFTNICARCNIPYSSDGFRNDDLLVTHNPTGDNVTYRDVMGWVAMLAGGNARMSRDGKAEILTYDFSDIEADGNPKRHDLTDWIGAPEVDTEPITITGVRTVTDDNTYMSGDDGYVLDVKNPLMEGKEQYCIDLLGELLVGGTLRHFRGDYVGYPLAEFMDPIKIQDWRGNEYYSVITDVDFQWFAHTTLACSAASPARNAGVYTKPEDAAVIKARELVEQERKAREDAIAHLNDAVQNGTGLFATDDPQQDGSVIHYLHDKPTLAESTNVIKVTAQAIGFSTDGGTTYPFGIEVSGEIVASILNAIGIQADWISIESIPINKISGLSQQISDTSEAISSVWGAVDINSEGISQNLEYIQQLEGVIKDTQAYIRTGIVDYEDNVPILGIAIGQDLKTTTDGEGNTVIKKENFRAIFTAKRLSFFQGETEVAYIKDGKLCINDAEIKKSMTLGNWETTDGTNGYVVKWIGG